MLIQLNKIWHDNGIFTLKADHSNKIKPQENDGKINICHPKERKTGKQSYKEKKLVSNKIPGFTLGTAHISSHLTLTILKQRALFPFCCS